jgi:hypothetical protein
MFGLFLIQMSVVINVIPPICRGSNDVLHSWSQERTLSVSQVIVDTVSRARVCNSDT